MTGVQTCALPILGVVERRLGVVERLKEVLEGGKFDKIYTCGPMPMMASVAKIGEVNGIDTEVSLEARTYNREKTVSSTSGSAKARQPLVNQ